MGCSRAALGAKVVGGTATIRRVKTSLAPPSRRAAARAELPARDEGNNAEATGAGAGTRGSGGGAGGGPIVPEKQALCQEILVDGYVQSYVDFFYLMHRPDPKADRGGRRRGRRRRAASACV